MKILETLLSSQLKFEKKKEEKESCWSILIGPLEYFLIWKISELGRWEWFWKVLTPRGPIVFFFLHSAIFLGDEGKIAENGFFLPDGGSRNGGNS